MSALGPEESGMTPRDLAEESWIFLDKVLGEVYERSTEDGEIRGPFIYRHARNVSDIGRDVLFLYQHERHTAARIAIRSMIESMLCVVAGTKIDSFPEEKVIAECENMIERITKLSTTNTDLNLSESVVEYTQLADSLRAKYSVTKNKKWNVYEIAEAAELKENYAGDYFIHCGYVHVTIAGIVSQEFGTAVGHSYRTAISTMIIAAAFLAQSLESADPQRNVDNAARLLGLLTEMMRQREFSDMEENEEE